MAYVPSFWDYLSQGLSGGIDSFQESRQRREEQERYDQAQKMQQLGFMSQLFGMGATDASNLNAAGANAGMNLNVQPNQAQLQRELQQPIPGFAGGGGIPAISSLGSRFDVASDVTRRAAGLPTRAQEATERAAGATANLTTRVAGIRESALGGKPVSSIERAVAELPQEGELEMKRLGEVKGMVNEFAPGYIAQVIAKEGGRINAKRMIQLSDEAFKTFTKSNKFLPPHEAEAYRQVFDQELFRLYGEQQDRDLRLMLAQIQKARDPQDMRLQTAKFIEASAGKMERQAAEMMKAMPLLGTLALLDPSQVDLSMQGPLQQYNAIVQEAQRRRDIATAYGAGQITDEAVVGLVTQLRAELEGGAPAGGPAQAAGLPKAPPMDPSQLDRAVARLKVLPADEMRRMLDQIKAIASPEDYTKITQALGVRQ